MPYILDKYIDPINLETARWYEIDLSVFDPDKVRSESVIDFIRTRVDFYCGSRLDYQSLKNKYNIRATLIETGMKNPTGSVFIQDQGGDSEKQNFVIVGNSMNPSNNHFSALLALSEANYSGEVYVISAYGYNDEKYRRSLAHFAHSAFGDKAKFLDNYMRPADFRNFVKTASAVILNHLRSQGASTALTALEVGTNLCMRRDTHL